MKTPARTWLTAALASFQTFVFYSRQARRPQEDDAPRVRATLTSMFVLKPSQAGSKREHYGELNPQLASLLAGEKDGLANAANAAALFFEALPELNWLGFYFLRGQELVLGPFQGKVACVRIAVGRGVCGTAARDRKTIIVPDVHAFPGHIACDTASRSEIVVPLLRGDQLL